MYIQKLIQINLQVITNWLDQELDASVSVCSNLTWYYSDIPHAPHHSVLSVHS